jgi:hypothetical protein
MKNEDSTTSTAAPSATKGEPKRSTSKLSLEHRVWTVLERWIALDKTSAETAAQTREALSRDTLSLQREILANNPAASLSVLEALTRQALDYAKNDQQADAVRTLDAATATYKRSNSDRATS